MKGLELFENIHPLFFSLLRNLFSPLAPLVSAGVLEAAICTAHLQRSSRSACVHIRFYSFIFSFQEMPSSMGHLPDKEENSVNCKKHHIRCMFVQGCFPLLTLYSTLDGCLFSFCRRFINR